MFVYCKSNSYTQILLFPAATKQSIQMFDFSDVSVQEFFISIINFKRFNAQKVPAMLHIQEIKRLRKTL